MFFIKNKYAEIGKNLGENELSKNGIYSFFAALRSNELDYHTFYTALNDDQAYNILRNQLIRKARLIQILPTIILIEM